MNTKNHCLDHSGHASRIAGLEDDNKSTLHTAESAHRRIDSMKNWVIAGMTSLVLQLVAMIGGIIIYWVRSAPAG